MGSVSLNGLESTLLPLTSYISNMGFESDSEEFICNEFDVGFGYIENEFGSFKIIRKSVFEKTFLD